MASFVIGDKNRCRDYFLATSKDVDSDSQTKDFKDSRYHFKYLHEALTSHHDHWLPDEDEDMDQEDGSTCPSSSGPGDDTVDEDIYHDIDSRDSNSHGQHDMEDDDYSHSEDEDEAVEGDYLDDWDDLEDDGGEDRTSL